MNTLLNFTDYREVTGVIEKVFTNNRQFDGKSGVAMQEFSIDKDSFYIYYNKENINIFIDSNLKKNFESKTKLRLEEVK
jgi:hypothetical protein